MPTISTSTTIVVPAGQKMTVQGGNATVTVNPGSLAQIYTLTGGDTDTFGPFDRATSLHIQITSGSVTYNTISEDSTPALIDDGQIVTPSGDVVGGIPGLINWKYSNTRELTAAYLGALSGAVDSRIYVSGDSGLFGTGAITDSTDGAHPFSAVAQLAKLLRGTGAEANAEWYFAGGLVGASLTSIAAAHTSAIRGTSLVHSASGVTYDTSKPGPTGGNWQVTTAGTVTIKPTRPFSRVWVLHGKAPAFGTLVLKDQNAVTAGTINCNIATGDNTVGLSFVDFPEGSTSVEISVTGSTTRFVGVGFDGGATKPGMQIVNMSESGQGAEFLSAIGTADPSYLSADACYSKLIVPGFRHVAICGGGANDINAGRTVEQVKGYWRRRYDRLLGWATTNGTKIGLLGYGVPPAGPAAFTHEERLLINTLQQEVTVDEYDLPFVSPFVSLPPHLDMQAIGMGATDDRHLRAPGYGEVARIFLRGFQYAASLKS